MISPSNPGFEKYNLSRRGYKWDVPIWYKAGNGTLNFEWLRRDEPLLINVDRSGPVVINGDRRGYFRQNYDSAGWNRIIKQLKEDHKVFDYRTRYVLLSDAFAAAIIDQLDYATLFELLEYTPSEKVRTRLELQLL
ncbi:unnamed protein product [Strongylus vulgaris]|uniref:ERAP1-like C-terminal domain-containing protein n=1 Tax=Strongylus vulgaris TaxID=40348 RepID=A0A3P7IBH4_STRVU|nr:unnamed protein product [Strongylus vulgaris]